MDLGIEQKLVLVSASSGGIGQAIALELAREGARVIVNGRTEARVEAAIAEIRSVLPEAQLESLVADLGSEEGVTEATRQWPKVDILVNNLGIYEAKPFAEIDDDAWRRIFEVNVLSGVRLSRHYLPSMLDQNWGRIVFISSESALAIPSEMIHYGMTKTAQLSIARGLAETTRGSAVTVNSILPGPTRTEGVETFIRDLYKEAGHASDEMAQQAFMNEYRSDSLIGRLIDPAEIAAVTAFVCSQHAAAINGAAIRTEGGLLRTIS